MEIGEPEKVIVLIRSIVKWLVLALELFACPEIKRQRYDISQKLETNACQAHLHRFFTMFFLGLTLYIYLYSPNFQLEVL